MDLFGKKEKALKEEIEVLKNERDKFSQKLCNMMDEYYEYKRKVISLENMQITLQEDNKKLREELEVKDYIGQGIHNILNYNGEPQSKV